MMRLLLLSPVLLAGCVSLLPEPPPPPALFVLEAGEVQRVQGAPLDVVIGVAAPQGERSLLGADLIWRTGDQLAYVSQTAWSGRAQESLQSLVVETIGRQGRVRAAVRAGDARSDYDVRWDVLDFEVAENGGAMTARFSADVRIVEALTRRVLASEIVTAEAPVSSRSATEAAQSLARAAQEGGARIGVFAVDAVSQAMAQADAQSSAESTSR